VNGRSNHRLLKLSVIRIKNKENEQKRVTIQAVIDKISYKD
jgi:hypothetical protein